MLLSAGILQKRLVSLPQQIGHMLPPRGFPQVWNLSGLALTFLPRNFACMVKFFSQAVSKGLYIFAQFERSNWSGVGITWKLYVLQRCCVASFLGPQTTFLSHLG